jgi:replicative DNA helicase
MADIETSAEDLLKELEDQTYFKFDSPTEEKLIVGYFYKDRSTFLKLAQYLVTKNWKKQTFFNDRNLQFIVNFCYAYSDKYKKMPHPDIVMAGIEKQKLDDFQKEELKDLFKSLQTIDYSGYSPDYLKDVAVDFIKKERAAEATYKCQAEIDAGHFDNLDKIMRDAINVNLDKDLGTSIKNVAEVLPMIQEVHDDHEGCTWGSKTLNEKIGRIQKGEIAVLAGLPGAGKTAWLGHLGLSSMKEKKNVIMFSFEVNTKRLATRIYKSLFNVDTSDLLKMTPDEAIKGVEDPTLGDFILVQRPANSCSANDISAILHDLKTYHNWEPDLILVDYLLITSTNDKRKDSSDTYKYYKTVTEELRNVAVEFDCPLITACQLNREAMGEKGGSKKVVTSKDISESRGVLDTADYLLILEQTEEEKKDGLYRVRLDKNRNGDNGFFIPFAIDWKTMRISETTLDKTKKVK